MRAGKKAKPNGKLRRIATQRITGVDEKNRLVSTIVDPDYYFADSTNSLHLSVDSEYSLEYVCALLNSSLMQWRFKLTSSNNNVGTNEIEALPFPTLDFTSETDRTIHEEICTLVQRVTELKNMLAGGNFDQVQGRRELKAHVSTLNKMIFGLYDVEERDQVVIFNG